VLRSERDYSGLQLRIMDSQCQNISILLRRYLQHLGVELQAVCGLLKPTGITQSIPHVFLNIGGTIIDNSYVCSDVSKDHKANRTMFFDNISAIKHVSIFSMEKPSTVSFQSFEEEFQQDGDDRQFGQKLLELGTENEHEQNKIVAFNIATAGIEPGCLIYDKLMRGFIKRAFQVDIPPVEEQMGRVCWSCADAGGELRTCGGCGVARYCGWDSACQRSDWGRVHKLLHNTAKKVAKNRMEVRFGIKTFDLRSLNP